MSQLSHHHFVPLIAIAVVVACAIGVLIARGTRNNNKKKIQVQDEDIPALIAQRLSTGEFSRAPSSFRRKAVDVDELPERKKQSNG